VQTEGRMGREDLHIMCSFHACFLHKGRAFITDIAMSVVLLWIGWLDAE